MRMLRPEAPEAPPAAAVARLSAEPERSGENGFTSTREKRTCTTAQFQALDT